MARGRSKRSATSNTVANASQDPLAALLRSPAMLRPVYSPVPTPLSLIEDLRQWHPLGDDRPFLAVDRRSVSFSVGPNSVIVHRRPVISRSNTLWSSRGLPVGVQIPVGVRVESPLKVITCIRRKARRAVMFARRKVGLGAKRRTRRRNSRSNVGC